MLCTLQKLSINFDFSKSGFMQLKNFYDLVVLVKKNSLTTELKKHVDYHNSETFIL